MAKTKKETDWLGREKEVHYDDSGNKIGETKFRETLFGNKIQEHFDTSGNKVGETRAREGLFSNWAEHTDAKGSKIGYSKDGETLFGSKYQTHYTPDGKVAGKTSYEHKICGDGYNKVHKGKFFKAGEIRDSAADYSYSNSGGYSANYSVKSNMPFIIKVVLFFAAVILLLGIYALHIHSIIPKTGPYSQSPDLKVKAPAIEVRRPVELPKPEKSLASIYPVSIFLGFFEDKLGTGGPPLFRSKFPQATTKYINYELRISSPAKEQVIAPYLDVVFYGPGGKVFARQKDAFRIPDNAVIAWHEGGRGYNQPGQWPAGDYMVEFRSGGKLVDRGKFSIE